MVQMGENAADRVYRKAESREPSIKTATQLKEALIPRLITLVWTQIVCRFGVVRKILPIGVVHMWGHHDTITWRLVMTSGSIVLAPRQHIRILR
ncbi:unnamed protein product [Protopolystoma xenopodis]|uniref:Uncharacterized protein n=1 Tax=Protopolystoma xenopodis TaxID=117903 RepID=A0A3S5CSA5_9PLAT|nr:unnamed protein product [Protopolystoma xenopodis]